MELKLRKNLLLALLVVGYCTSILAVDERLRDPSLRSIADTRPHQSSSHLQRSQLQQQQQRLRFPRRLSSRHNELASTELSKKASSSSSHMLIGGHLRTEAAAFTDSTTTPSAELTTITAATTTTTSAKSTNKRVESTLDDGLLLSSAGNGKEKKGTTKSTDSSDDEEKKTLSQQVKEGKYGLIQDEIFPKKPKRPGVISYSTNPEVPGDTAKNFGGLDEEEIWLAENHVLVLKGGNFPEPSSPDDGTDLGPDVISWPPIDDYKAPRRQVKIPPRPKVPPPFPVQLLENGPIELIGTNGSILAENGTIDFEALPGGFRGFLPGEGPYFPFPPANNHSDVLGDRKNKADGAPGPFYPALPPGAVIVPPPSNQTDYDDEDQSVYYPPPYSFVYPQDNSTAIPPGPLVPGIILPPPPDFFSSLVVDDAKKTTATATKDKFITKRPSSTTPLPGPSRQPSYLPPRKSSTKLYKTPSVTSTPVGSKTASYNPKPFSRSKLQKNSTYHQYQVEKTSPRPYINTLPFVEVTTPSVPKVKSTTLESPEKYHIQPLLSNQVIETSTEKPVWKAVVSSKAVPLVTYYATTTPSSVDEPVETTPSSVKDVLTTESPTHYPSQASYYFYEESSNEETPTSTPAPVVFFGTTAETPPYYKLELPQQPEQQQQQQREEQPVEGDKKEYYDVEMIPSQQTSKDYNVKLIDSIVKDPQIFRYLDSGATSNQEKFETSPVRSQSPRMLHSEPLYYQPVPTRTSSKLNYFSTPKPKSYYHRPEISDGYEFDKPATSKSKPIYQYSFEATNYAKRSRPSLLSQKPELHEQQIQQPRRQKELNLFNEYQNIQSVSDQYDYEGSEPVADQQVQTEKVPYISPKKKERAYFQQSTTAVPIRGTTLAGHQQYFTRQDEQLLDDVTKEYFTMFGKKLPSTTPIYGKSSVTERPTYSSVNSYGTHEYTARQPSAFRPSPNIRVHYGDHTPGPFSLAEDIRINYKQPLPSINRESEFLPVANPTPQPPPQPLVQKYRPRPVLQVGSQVRDYSLGGHQRFDQIRGYSAQPQVAPARDASSFVPISDPRETIRGAGYPPRPISLEGDIAVNYKHPRPPINPDAEFIGTGAGLPSHIDTEKPNSYFAYRLPGDGGHFYFLTPQAISREDSEAGYLYSRPRGSGLLRRRRGRDSG